MEINKLNISLLFLVIALFSISLSFPVSAVTGVTINHPASNSLVDGTKAVINVTIAGSITDFICNFYAKSSLTANSTWVLVANMSNTTIESGTGTEMNLTFDTNVIEDANNYYFNATCFNFTDAAYWNNVSAATSGIIVDNTVPTAPTVTTPSDDSIDADGTFTFNVSVTGKQTTSCILYFDGINPGTPNYAMTHDTDSCYYAVSALPDQTYNWYVIANDSTNTTFSETFSILVGGKSSTSKIPALLEEPGVSSTGGASLSVASGINSEVANLPVWAWILIIGIGAVVVYKIKKR